MARGLLAYAGAGDIAAGVPLGRLGSASDMGGAAVFLASPAGAWVTGHVLTVDGGTTCQPLHMASALARLEDTEAPPPASAAAAAKPRL